MSNGSTSLWSSTVAQLRDRVGSTDPTPGGGSVSMIAAALGAASVHKGIVVSLKKSNMNSERHQSLLNLRSKASSLIATLSELADADSLAFRDYLKAHALPAATEDERAARKSAEDATLVCATEIPLRAAAEMGQGLVFIETAGSLVDAHVLSEVLAGGVLVRASIKSVLFSVDANLSGISDMAKRESFRQRRNELQRMSEPPTKMPSFCKST